MTYQFVDIEQQTPQWEEFRKGKIGASMAPDIMGVGFRTPLQLWEQIVFDIPTFENDAMRRGKELEPIARECINKKLGIDFKPAVVQSTQHSWFIASLDGINKGQAIEIKCPQKRYMPGVVPEMYKPQLQHQMRLLGIPVMIFVNFYAENDFDIVEMEYDGPYAENLFSRETLFKSQIDDFVPPETQDKDWVEIIDSSLLETAEKLISTKAMIKQLEMSEKELETELKRSLTNPRCKIGNLKAQKILRKGTVDYGKIEVLQGLNLEPYRKKPSEYWKFG